LTKALQRGLRRAASRGGGDKLVAVVSHLHAVAEAVEDVMWVERRPEGFSARCWPQPNATTSPVRTSQAACSPST